MNTTGGVLIGDWRRRMGSTTDAHLYRYGHKPSDQPIGPDKRYPVCGKRIPMGRTIAPKQGRPCYDCLAIAAAGR